MTMVAKLLSLGAICSLIFAFALAPVRAGTLTQPTNIVFHALWQFESDTSFETGLMMDAGLLKLKACSADRKRGANGEVSRFQILPQIWEQYAASSDYSDPELAWSVAEKIFTDRIARYFRATGRQPNAFDLYVLWNAPGHFERVGFEKKRVRPVVSERAQRFANLVERYTTEPIFKTAKR